MPCGRRIRTICREQGNALNTGASRRDLVDRAEQRDAETVLPKNAVPITVMKDLAT
jgi:hypothetical protein